MNIESIGRYETVIAASLGLAAIGIAIFIDVYVSQHFHKFHCWQSRSPNPVGSGFQSAGWKPNFACCATVASSVLLYCCGITGLFSAFLLFKEEDKTEKRPTQEDPSTNGFRENLSLSE